MTPIQDLLNRIRWDQEFGAAKFEVGYFDRVLARIVRVRFEDVRREGGGSAALEVLEDDGSVHSVPLHRVREVWRDGVLVWERRGDRS